MIIITILSLVQVLLYRIIVIVTITVSKTTIITLLLLVLLLQLQIPHCYYSNYYYHHLQFIIIITSITIIIFYYWSSFDRGLWIFFTEVNFIEVKNICIMMKIKWTCYELFYIWDSEPIRIMGHFVSKVLH